MRTTKLLLIVAASAFVIAAYTQVRQPENRTILVILAYAVSALGLGLRYRASYATVLFFVATAAYAFTFLAVDLIPFSESISVDLDRNRWANEPLSRLIATHHPLPDGVVPSDYDSGEAVATQRALIEANLLLIHCLGSLISGWLGAGLGRYGDRLKARGWRRSATVPEVPGGPDC